MKKPCAKSARCFQAELAPGARLILSGMPALHSRAPWPSTFTAYGMTLPCEAVPSICPRLGSGVAWSYSDVGSPRIALIPCFRAAHDRSGESPLVHQWLAMQIEG